MDVLANTNRFQVSKTVGLFKEIVQHLKISSHDMGYIGDSEERDVLPAMASDIFAIHFAETRDTSIDSVPVRVSTLNILQHISKSKLDLVGTNSNDDRP